MSFPLHPVPAPSASCVSSPLLSILQEWRKHTEFDNIYKLAGVPVITVQLRYNGWVTEMQDPEKVCQSVVLPLFGGAVRVEGGMGTRLALGLERKPDGAALLACTSV